MKVYTMFEFSDGNALLVYENEDGAELYYHNYADDTDTFICEVSNADILNIC